MKGTVLTLSSQWTVGDLLGSGGFGRVYELTGGDQPAVAKFVPKAPGADRELLFVGLEGVRNVVPIIDSGEHQDTWVLVMPRAEKSLRQHLEDSGEVLDGHRPFAASTMEDYRELHLHHNPPGLDGVPVALATLLDECLFKSPATRPSPENLLARHNRQAAPASGGLAALQAANQSQVRRQIETEREASIVATASEQREERVAAAKVLYERIADSLRDAIMGAAPSRTAIRALHPGVTGRPRPSPSTHGAGSSCTFLGRTTTTRGVPTRSGSVTSTRLVSSGGTGLLSCFWD